MINYDAVNPMNAFMQTAGGLQSLQNNNIAMQQQYDQQAAAQQQAEAQQQAVAQAQQLLQNGTPAEIAQFGIANPELMTRITDAVGFKDNAQKQGRLSYARDVASGRVDPIQATQQRIAELESQGMDASHLKARLSMSPNEVVSLAEKDISVMDPKGYVDFLTAQGGGISPQQQQQNRFKQQELGLQREKFNFDKKMRELDFNVKKAERQAKQAQGTAKEQEAQLKLADAKAKADEAKAQDRERIQGDIVNSQKSIANVNDILNSSDILDSVSGFANLSKVPELAMTPTQKKARSYFENVKNSLTIENLGAMQGPLTDSDVRIIASAASRLDYGMSESDIKKELNLIKKTYESAVKKYEREAERKGFSVESQQTPQQQVATGDYSSLWLTPQ